MQRIIQWLKQAEAMLDEWGKGAWIAAMILGFVLAWPLGLAILAYMIWSGRMFCCRPRRQRHAERARPTGNAAFDDYRAETLRRLEEEQSAFEGFLDRLRRAKDQAEFDQFMAERGNGTSGEPQSA
jgi:hypothetical protein